MYGVNGSAVGTNTIKFNIGVNGTASGDAASDNIGVDGEAFAATDNNYGIQGYACNASTMNIGVLGKACTTGTGIDWACYMEGDCITTATSWQTSDKRLKTNIRNLDSGLEGLRQLPIYSYNFKSTEGMNLPASDKLQYGPLAQELEKIFPDLVLDTKTPFQDNETKVVDFKAVNYIGLIPILIRSVQELDEKLATLEETNETLRKQLNDDAVIDKNTTGSADIIQVQDKASMTLMPNPSNDLMTVAVKMESCSNCSLVITDLQGKLISNIRLSSSGRQTISKSEIGEGIYLCNLVVDGNYVSVERIVFL